MDRPDQSVVVLTETGRHLRPVGDCLGPGPGHSGNAEQTGHQRAPGSARDRCRHCSGRLHSSVGQQQYLRVEPAGPGPPFYDRCADLGPTGEYPRAIQPKPDESTFGGQLVAYRPGVPSSQHGLRLDEHQSASGGQEVQPDRQE